MRFPVVTLALMEATIGFVQGFSRLPLLPSSSSSRDDAFTTAEPSVCSARSGSGTSSTAPFRAEKVVNGVIFSGDPPEAAYAMNHYDILLQHSIQAPGSGDAEQIVSYDRIRPLLLAKGVPLTLVSIGLPEKALALQEHLNVQTSIYVDPTNRVYDALLLRRGVDRTFGNINTPLSFLDRWFANRGRTEQNKKINSHDDDDDDDDALGIVLKKWWKAFYIPPEQHQAFLQGGTFIFRTSKAVGQTIYAFYDPSTAAHPSLERVLELASPPPAERIVHENTIF